MAGFEDGLCDVLANTKPGRHLGNRKVFPLATRQNLTAKINGICYP